MLVANVFQQLYNVVDSYVVGRFISKEALAAVGASFPVIWVLISLLIGIATGISIIISQFYGAKQYDNVNKAINTFYFFILISSLVITVLGIYFARDIFMMLKLPAELIEPATSYLHIYMAGTIFTFGFFGTMAILRGLGDSKTPLYFTIISTLLNVLLDFAFVLWFNMGIEGVAIASVIAQFVAFVGATLYINKGDSMVKFSLRNLSLDWEIFMKSLKIGLPSGLQHSFVAIGMIAVLRIVNDFGTDAVAAFSVAGRLDSFAGMPAMALATALSAFVGQNIGAQRIDRVRQGFKVSLIISAVISLLVTVVMVFFGETLMGIFTTDKNVIDIGYSYLVIVSVFYVVFSSMFIVQSVLRGAGDTWVPMVFTLFALWILRVPLSYFLSRESFGLGVIGIWWGIPIAWVFGLASSYIYYRMGRWRSKSVVNHAIIEEVPEI